MQSNHVTDSAIAAIFRAGTPGYLAGPESSSQAPLKYTDVPDELKAPANWVCFRHEDAPKGGKQNRPYAINGSAAKVNDSSTWSTFDDAVQAPINPARNFDGISFMLLGTPYLGFDFDDVVQNEIVNP
jgi:primase-polymerase (primpol)-like protein